MPLLRMEHIKKAFPGVLALDDVNIDINEGEVHALVGENGAGKSTLIKLLYGVYKPDKGNIYIDDKLERIQNEAQAISLGIGVVFQELNLCPDLDIANNIFLGRIKNRFGIIDDKWAVNETRKLLDSTVKLKAEPTCLIKDLSIADKQMVEITKVISHGCRIVVFDEPTSSLANNEIQHLFKIINDLKRQGVGIIYISHRLEELEHIADRVTVLRDGKQIDTSDYKNTSKNKIIKHMVGREIQNIYPIYKRKIGDVIFEAKNIRYKNKINVDHIDVRSGEILGLSGLVGSGRSEAMRAIFCADPVDSKLTVLDGNECEFKNIEDAINSGFVYMTEDRKLCGLALGLNIEFNINMASHKKLSRYGVINGIKARSNANKYIDLLDIRVSSLNKLVRDLSGGNQQKVVLSKWLSRNAKIIVFDEPTKGIDVGTKYEIYNIMNQLSDEGLGIVMISSDLPEILGMSDRILVFRNGSIAAEFDKNEAESEIIMKFATGAID